MQTTTLRKMCNPCLNAFGLILDAKGEVAPLQILKNDETSVVIRARCMQDGDLREFVLKGTPARLHRQVSSVFELEAMLALNAHGVVVPSRLHSSSGDSPSVSTATIGDTIWSVTGYEENQPSFDWLSQSENPWNGAQTRSAGAMLAKVHAASQSIKPGFLELGCAVEPSIAAHVPKLLFDAFVGVDKKYLTSIGLGHLEDHSLVAIVSKAVFTLENSVHAHALKAEELVVHGDYQPGNVLYRNNQAFGLIDWDYARLENPLMDVAYGLLMFAGNLASEDGAFFDTNLSRQFLQGYTDQITIIGREPVCMPDVFFAPAVRDNHVFSSYMKLSAALILLWSLSEYGQNHPCGVVVGKRTSRLMQSL